MNLETIMLLKDARHQTPHIIGFHLYEMSRIRLWIYNDRNRVAGSHRKGGWK